MAETNAEESSVTKRRRESKIATESRHEHTPTMSWKNLVMIAARKKKLKPSPIKHFYILIYFLYFRYKVEFGITLMTYPEAVITNTMLGFLVFSVINLGSRFVFNSFVRLWHILRCVVWAYSHMND